MFERHGQPLISSRRFAVRVLKGLLLVAALDGAAILMGAIGYHAFEGMDWLSASCDAVMVITGNGLVTPMKTVGGQIFSMFDALVGVLLFVTLAGIVLAPIFHRILQTFRLDVPDRSR
jgi:hypothetical protein